MVKGEISRIFAGEKEGRKKLEKFCKKLLTFVPNSYYNSQAVGNKEEQKYCKYHGILAQLGEHLPYKQRVTGSSPVGPIFAENAKHNRIWRNSSVGESTRFIPVVSGVQIPLPLLRIEKWLSISTESNVRYL